METSMDFFRALWDNFSSTEVNLTNAIFRLALSAILGVVVGAERKRKGQIAGVRTFALITMGACLAMLLSIYVPQEYIGLKNGDPGRIAAQVITGVGFLGGGAMIHLRGAVRGLTTAAGIWMTAIVGMAVGIGMYAISVFATVFCLLVLVAFEWYEQAHRLGQENRVIEVKVDEIIDNIDRYREIFKEHDVHLSKFYLVFDYERHQTDINFVVLSNARLDFFPVFRELEKAAPTKSITLTSQPEI